MSDAQKAKAVILAGAVEELMDKMRPEHDYSWSVELFALTGSLADIAIHYGLNEEQLIEHATGALRLAFRQLRDIEKEELH